MQIRTGTCSLILGSAVVVASPGNDWSAAGANCLFSVPGPAAVLYTVATVTAPGASMSGFWELALTAPWALDDAADVAYQITKDFTPTLGLALLQRGDTDSALIVNRNLLLLEGLAYAAITPATSPPFLGTFDDYTGGVSGRVDSIPTVSLTKDILYMIDHATEGAKVLKLNTGTAATALPGTFRPADYNAITNPCYWTIR